MIKILQQDENYDMGFTFEGMEQTTGVRKDTNTVSQLG